MSKISYTCPVCGFTGLAESPYTQKNEPSYEICPCCGFEFGFDSVGNKGLFIEFRQRWIKNGAQWFIQRLRPENWDLEAQLMNVDKGAK